MIALGGRPLGLSMGVSQTADFNIAEQLAYIEKRSGYYDEREKMILDDPWIHGHECGEKGLSLEVCPMSFQVVASMKCMDGIAIFIA